MENEKNHTKQVPLEVIFLTELLLLFSLKAGTIKVLRSTLSVGWSKKKPQKTVGRSVNRLANKQMTKQNQKGWKDCSGELVKLFAYENVRNKLKHQ